MRKETMNDIVTGVKPLTVRNTTINLQKFKRPYSERVEALPINQPTEFILKKSTLSLVTRKEKRKFVAERKIDLHGLTKNEAFQKMLEFLSKCQSEGVRKILVITGGNSLRNSVLRCSFQSWIDENFGIFVSKCVVSKIRDGGDGAFYVFLKPPKT